MARGGERPAGLLQRSEEGVHLAQHIGLVRHEHVVIRLRDADDARVGKGGVLPRPVQPTLGCERRRSAVLRAGLYDGAVVQRQLSDQA